jgi:hypothetical protein
MEHVTRTVLGVRTERSITFHQVSQLRQQGKRKTWLQGIHTNPDADFSRQNSRKAKTVASEGKLSGKDSV